MASSFQFSIENDFPNQAVDASVLTAEINAAAGGAAVVEGITIEGDTVTIEFDSDLSSGAEAALNAVIAAHQGTGFVEGVQRVFVEAEQTEPGTTYVTAGQLDSGILAAGDYLIGWYCEFSVLTANGTSGVAVQVTWNGTERGFDHSFSEFTVTSMVRYLSRFQISLLPYWRSTIDDSERLTRHGFGGYD